MSPQAAKLTSEATSLQGSRTPSKWNKIEHRMFSAITMNWPGRPLETHEVVVETIAATTTRTGLTVQAMLDTNTYQRGIKTPTRR